MEVTADSMTINSYKTGDSYSKLSFPYGCSGNTFSGSYFDRKEISGNDTLQMAGKYETKNNEVIIKEFASKGYTVRNIIISFYRRYKGDIPYKTWPKKFMVLNHY